MMLVVGIKAQIVWADSPKDIEEEIMRKRTNIMVAKAARQIESAMELLVAECLNAQVS